MEKQLILSKDVDSQYDEDDDEDKVLELGESNSKKKMWFMVSGDWLF